jgi:hypothetical protein
VQHPHSPRAAAPLRQVHLGTSTSCGHTCIIRGCRLVGPEGCNANDVVVDWAH